MVTRGCCHVIQLVKPTEPFEPTLEISGFYTLLVNKCSLESIGLMIAGQTPTVYDLAHVQPELESDFECHPLLDFEPLDYGTVKNRGGAMR